MSEVATPAPDGGGGATDGSRPDPVLRRVTWGVALAGALAVLAVTRVTHASVGTDGVCYIAVGDHLVAGKGLGFFLESPLVTWPPLWPAVLAAGRWVTNWRGDVVGVVVNAAMVSVTVVLASKILRRILHTRWLVVCGIVLVGFAPTVVGLAAVVQTETIFNLLVFAAVWWLLRYRDDGRAMWLVGVVVAVWLAFLARYAGLYLVPLFAGWLLVPRAAEGRLGRPATWRWVPAVGLALAAASVPAAWVARNLHVSDTALGPRYPSGVGVPRNTAEALSGITKYLVGLRELPTTPGALVALVAVAALVLVAGRWFVTQRGAGGTIDRLGVLVSSSTGLLVVVAAGFTAILVVSRSQYGFDNLDVRLLAPSLLLGSMAALAVVERCVLDRPASDPRGAASARTTTLVRAGVIAWCGYQALIVLLLVGPLNSIVADSGYNADRAVAVSTSPALRRVPPDCRLYSNNPFDLYRGGTEAQLSPRRHQWQSPAPTGELDALIRRVQAGRPSCLAWVAYTDDDNFVTLTTLRRRMTVSPVVRDGDLTVYTLSPR